MEHHPFKVGQRAEARTWEEGFRGAWFRCKIRKISKRKGRPAHQLEYVDFPEEKLEWSMLYQDPEDTLNGKNYELMLRPPFPPRKTEKQLLHVSEISEVTVIGGDSWRVGDLVDWWTSDCYWSGRITELLSDKEAKIQLHLPPLGEGLSYTALLEDLRPSLHWSTELGWTVPTQEGGSCCARLVKPINQVIETSKEIESGPRSDGSFFSSPVSSNSAIEAKSGTSATKKTNTCSTLKRVSKKQKHGEEKKLIDSSTSKTSRVVADSGQIEGEPAAEIAEDKHNSECGQEKTNTCSQLKRVSEKRKHKQEKKPVDSSRSKTSQVVADYSGQNEAEPAAEIAEDKLNADCGQKKNTACRQPVLHSKGSDTLEAAILDLEEYVNKVKWLRRIMQYGISSSDAQGSQWEFVG